MNKIATTKLLLATPFVMVAGLFPVGCATSTDGADPNRTYFDGGALQDPEPMTIVLTGRVLKSQGRLVESEYILRRLIAEYPDFGPGYLELGELLVKDGRTSEAIMVLEKGITELPEEARLLNDLGICLVVGGDFPRAQTMFEAARRFDPSEATYTSNLAMAHGLQGRYDRALELYVTVIPSLEAHENVARLAEAQGDTERARSEMELAGRPEER